MNHHTSYYKESMYKQFQRFTNVPFTSTTKIYKINIPSRNRMSAAITTILVSFKEFNSL
jgi:hypothetical protein